MDMRTFPIRNRATFLIACVIILLDHGMHAAEGGQSKRVDRPDAEIRSLVDAAVHDNDEGRYQDALEKLQNAIQESPESVTPYEERAIIEYGNGYLLEAVDDLEKATSLNPGDATDWELLALDEQQAGIWRKSLNSWNQYCRTVKTEESERWNNYQFFCIWTCWVQLGDNAEASKFLASLIDNKTFSHSQQWELAVAEFLLGRISDSDLRAMTKMYDPNGYLHYCQYFYYSGLKSEVLGDRASAGRSFKQCLVHSTRGFTTNYPEYDLAKAEDRRLADYAAPQDPLVNAAYPVLTTQSAENLYNLYLSEPRGACAGSLWKAFCWGADASRLKHTPDVHLLVLIPGIAWQEAIQIGSDYVPYLFLWMAILAVIFFFLSPHLTGIASFIRWGRRIFIISDGLHKTMNGDWEKVPKARLGIAIANTVRHFLK